MKAGDRHCQNEAVFCVLTGSWQVMNDTERLKSMDLVAFSARLQEVGFGDKSKTVSDICAELENPFRDTRHEFRRMMPHELFTCVTGESIATPNRPDLVSHGVRRTACNHLSRLSWD